MDRSTAPATAGVSTTPPAGDPPGTTPPSPQLQATQQQGQTPPPASTTPPSDNIASLPDWAQRIIHELRDESKTRRLEAEAATRAKHEAEAAKMREQGQYKELSEQQTTELARLKPYEQEVGDLSSFVGAQIDEQITDWPASVKNLYPKASPIKDRMAWVKQMQPVVDELKGKQTAALPGNAPAPRPAQTGTQPDGVQTLYQRYEHERGRLL